MLKNTEENENVISFEKSSKGVLKTVLKPKTSTVGHIVKRNTSLKKRGLGL
jgi:hypothetical protein